MLRKLILTETEKKQISSLHRLLNEDDGFATLQGYVKYKINKVPHSIVKLFQVVESNEKLIKGAETDENGFFKIENIPLGKYICKVTNKNEGYEDLVENIDLSQPKVYNQDFTFRDVQNVEEVKVKTTFDITSLSVQVNDEFNAPIPNATITIKYNRTDIEFGNNVTDNNGMLSNIILDKTKYPVFDAEASGELLNITVGVKYFNIKENIEKTIKLNNSMMSKGDEDNPNSEKKLIIRKGYENVVNFKIKTTTPFKVSVIDENDNPLMGSDIQVYGDDETTPLISGKGVVTSKVKDVDKIVVEVANQGYISVKRRYNLNFNGENEIEVKLKKIKPPRPPKPPKDINERQCIRLTRDFYNDMVLVNDGSKTIIDLGGEDVITERRQDVESCFLKYKDKYPRRANQMVKRLVHVGSKLKIFGLRFTLEQNKDIYKENRIMSVSNTIRKVISEHIEKKQIISEEKKLINKRYKFSLVGINKNRRRIVESTLRDERIMLLRAGYNKTIVNETFLDVMNGLYGAEGNNVLKDIKTRLGQKIADQVKNKEDEHNMILSAFEELPEDVIERAIKENRVDELSAMIATKAMEGYKTSFGTEGISGLMFASVDENKFKQEVAKLIEPAIKDITTKMDEKFKQVQDVVSGIGLNPTA
jgi:hypothetical protein